MYAERLPWTHENCRCWEPSFVVGISGAAKLLLRDGWLIECWDRSDHSSSLELLKTVKKCAFGCSGRIARAQMMHLSSVGNLGKSVNIFGAVAGLMPQKEVGGG